MRRWLPAAGLYGVVTLVLVLPLLGSFGSLFPHDAGDPVLNTWILWWSSERLPLTAAWWHAPMFFPMANAMALSELLVGLLPIAAPVQWLTHNPVAAYNVAFVLSFPLCGLAAYALASEVSGRRDAALLAGLAFAFAPYRMGQLAHLQVLSYYWAPLALLGLHRFLRTDRHRWLGLFAVSWMMQALANGYALFHLSLLVALWLVWFVRSPRALAAIGAAWGCALLPLLPILLSYQRVHDSLHLVRDINEIKRFGVDLADILSAPPELALWGSRLWTARPETAVFPGATMLVVGAAWLVAAWWRERGRSSPRTLDQQVLTAVSGVAGLVALSVLTWGPWSLGPLSVSDFHKPFSIAVGARLLAALRGGWMRRAWRTRSTVAFYAVAMVAMYLFALGPEPRLLGRPLLYEPPYAWAMRLPGFDVLRVPARFAMLGVLCQALLLALAVTRWRAVFARPIVVVLVGGALLADGWIQLPVEAAPSGHSADWAGVAAVIELPPGRLPDDVGAIYRSMWHKRPVVNGYSGYNPPHYLPLVFAIRDGDYSALRELSPGAPLGLAIPNPGGGVSPVAEAVRGATGASPGPPSAGWITLILPSHEPVRQPVGAPIAVARVSASRFTQDVARISDGTVETAWHGGTEQVGDEEVLIDMGSPQEIGSVVLDMGAFAFGFPRDLRIDRSLDGREWTPAWRGATATLTVRAAVAEPTVVPLTIDLGRVSARFLRLQQLGTEPGIPWWIPELRVHAPATDSR